MSRRTACLIAAIAAISLVVGCSSGSGTPGAGSQTQQAGATQNPTGATQQPAGATQTQPAAATQQPGAAQAPQACAVLNKDQVGAEFGATFGAGKQITEMAPPNASSSTRCTFETSLANGNPWTFSLIVETYPTETASKGKMTDNRTTTSYTGDTLWAVTEWPGVGDDAVIQNLLTLKNTQENLVVRKGTVIYDFQDTIITGIADSAAARGHLANLAHLVVG
jgi:hypothetical protein